MPKASIPRRCGTEWPPIADPRGISPRFKLGGEVVSAERHGSGHINDTYVVTARQGRGDVRFVLQRINRDVFPDPQALMENVRRVTDHLGKRVPEGRPSLSLVPTVDDQDFHVDEAGEYWRVFRYLEGTRSYDSIATPAHAREAAAEFGRFQAMLHDLPGPRLNETITDFHNTPARYAQFHDARQSDKHARVKDCSREIDQALEYEDCAATLVDVHEAGDIPERVTHNDTKINNVMFDLETDKAVCVIDLDTVMPGLAPYDFGDLVRTATCPAAEDESDLSRITMHMDYYEALVDGYLDASAGFIREAEADNLALAGKIITIETGLRFLTDHLSGDTYFRVHRPDQNLERCRAQFALAESIDAQLDKMRELTNAAYRRRH